MKNVLITGCSSGIGLALALELNQRKYKVWATARNLESIQSLSEQGIKTAELDVTDEAQITRVLEEIRAEDGKVDILINNAGYGGMGAVAELPREELLKQFETNVFAPVLLANQVIQEMSANKEGVIINIGSISGEVTTPFSGLYCASKAAFNAFSDALRMELQPFGIKVLTVLPGAIQSRFAENANIALDRVFAKGSLYFPIEEGVRARANASQDRPTPAEKVASEIAKWLESPGHQGILRVGNGSRALPGLKRLLPVSWFEAILRRRFRLNRLSVK
ncbi:SDR family oxidoreductase [Endozoicomonas numazuensis]|uniref:Short-chain dehydrogenase n=1 Tax=Endozoicomonas numazuensis TaxID=1137799 RepID=A0A081NI33_9GAMM|nr:SDR family oxidoreductase [Endozoicomonas numazuensis]KEQ18106.1 short-chain dehydrogenase [Endozoicomonas numazuensis]